MKLGIVTATTNQPQAQTCIESWGDPDLLVIVHNGPNHAEQTVPGKGQIVRIWSNTYLGSVEAFQKGVNFALDQSDVDVIACFHDDLEIYESGWQRKLARLFKDPALGLAGFGGAIGLGSDDLYQSPYVPVQLARIGFRSNLVDAEAHGVRSLLPEQVACLDGFSQIGRREFFLGLDRNYQPAERPWDLLHRLGIVHHAYDGMLGCLAARYGWTAWYLPVACRHFGGRTAVGDQGYAKWAESRGGDHAFWERAHRIWYDEFRDQLPLRV